MSQKDQFIKYSYWDMITDEFYPNCYLLGTETNYNFRGIIASMRTLKYTSKQKVISVFLGISKNKYIEVIIHSTTYVFNKNTIGIYGKGVLKDRETFLIECNHISTF
jgi:hypothetical protein